MSALSNPRQERFAQELAQGKTFTESYRLAGYKESRQHAARLATNGDIKARVDELSDKSANKAIWSKAEALSRLLRYADKAEGMEGPAAVQAARASIMDAAKLSGWIIDKAEKGAPGEFADLDADARQSVGDAIRRELAGRVGGAGAGATAKPH